MSTPDDKAPRVAQPLMALISSVDCGPGRAVELREARYQSRHVFDLVVAIPTKYPGLPPRRFPIGLSASEAWALIRALQDALADAEATNAKDGTP